VVGPELGVGIAQPGAVADGSEVDGDEDAVAEGDEAGGAEAGDDEVAAEVEASAAAVPVDGGWVRSLKQ
jgi:hypothetical protein